MRENKGARKGLENLKVVYEIRGLNLDRFINTAKNRGIELYDIKKTGNKRMIVSVSFHKSQKFFAFAKELCYNIKKLRVKGLLYPLYSLYRSFGLIIGAVIFAFISVVSSDTLLSFTFTGSGSLYHREIEAYLYGVGVKPFARFSDFDLELLEDGILKDNPYLSFAGLRKSGNRLVINTQLSKDKVETLNGSVYATYSDCDGIIESIKVYRGTALVGVGDTVKKGQLLVDGYTTVKEQTVKINVLATVTVKTCEEVIYRSDKDGEEEKAVIFAEQGLLDKSVVETSVEKKQDGGGFIYIVKAYYYRVIYSG